MFLPVVLIKNTVNGSLFLLFLLVCFPPESFTADHKPLMGEAPEVRGFFLGCGFNSAGKSMELKHTYTHLSLPQLTSAK